MANSVSAAGAPHVAYRPDIDGLRAVAVLSVVLYHGFPNWNQSGFIGVDIFFVISGYLISTIIFDGVESGRFSYLDFYDRRIRRIFPALILVMATCLTFAVVFAFPGDAKSIGKHLMGGAGFVSNLLLWSEAGYFDGASELKPMLHFWSLSVEEQYYIVWPLVVAALFSRRRLFLAVMLGLFTASFCLNAGTVSSHPDAVFYSPLSRFWELLVGSGLAYALRQSSNGCLASDHQRGGVFAAMQRHAHLASIAGAILLACGYTLINAESRFPGWWALLPTVGAALLIGAGSHGWVNRHVLARRPFVFIGKISYPLYLWHWPLLAFPKIYFGAAPREMRIVAVVASFVLAWLTYRWLERPIRFGPRGPRVPFALAGSVAAIAAFGLLLFATDGWVNRLPAEMREIATADMRFDYSSYRERQCFLAKDQTAKDFVRACSPSPQSGRLRVALWGDSHAASLYPGISKLNDEGRPVDVTQFTQSGCPPVLGFTVEQRPHCQETNDVIFNRLLAARPDLVVLAANWTLYNGRGGWEYLDVQRLGATIRRLQAGGVKHIVLLGQLPRWTASQPTLLLREWRKTGGLAARSYTAFNADSRRIDAAIAGVAASTGVDFVSPIERLCDTSGCLRTVIADGSTFAIAWDDAHLTPEASTMLMAEWIGPLLSGAPVAFRARSH